MATIRASCPDCGDVEFTTRDVQVRVSAEDGSGTYSFRCPGCIVTVVKSAEPRTIDLLLASGVENVSGANLPTSSLPFGHDASSPPFHESDILRFRKLMDEIEDLVSVFKRRWG